MFVWCMSVPGGASQPLLDYTHPSTVYFYTAHAGRLFLMRELRDAGMLPSDFPFSSPTNFISPIRAMIMAWSYGLPGNRPALSLIQAGYFFYFITE